jgi:hypothetical protein
MTKVYDPYRRAPGTVDAGADFARQLDGKARRDARTLVQLDGRVAELEDRVLTTRTRTFMLPLDQSCAVGALPDDEEGWSFLGGQAFINAAGIYNERRWSFRLIEGAILTRVRIGYVSAGADVDVVVRRTRANKVSPFVATVDDLVTLNLVAATTQEIDSGALAAESDGTLDTFAVDITGSATGQTFRYIEVEVSEPGQENL